MKIKILIVGGGSSGWITAALIKKHHWNSVDVQLIESKSIPTIGVGEATVPSLITVLKKLGISENEFLSHCRGSFKLAIKFVNWRSSPTQHPHQFLHPFGHMPKIDTEDISQYWLRRKELGVQEPFAEACSIIPTLCQQNKAPRDIDAKNFQGLVEYAYHIDAGLLADLLKKYSIQWGVEHLIGEVQSVELNKEGEIANLSTDSHGKISADLYIDCTGFRSLLLGEALQEPFYQYQASLPCDRAIAISIPRSKQDSYYNNFTTAHALDAGWVWNIPLQNRDGTGYVYSSTHTSSDQAEREFRKFLGAQADQLASHHINIRVGRHRNAWVKNCIGIGLAGGFVEPLESSGLAFIYTAVQNLLPLILDFKQNEKGKNLFNQLIASLYDLIRDFLILHYCTTDRSDSPFWLDCQNSLLIPDSLQKNLELWSKRLPEESENERLINFNNFNVLCILAGMGYLPEHCKAGIAKLGLDQIETIFQKLKKRALNFADHLPGHGNYLRHLKGPD